METEDIKTTDQAMDYVLHTLESNAQYEHAPQVVRDTIDIVREHLKEAARDERREIIHTFLNEHASQIVEQCWEQVIDPILHDYFTPEQHALMMEAREKIWVEISLK